MRPTLCEISWYREHPTEHTDTRPKQTTMSCQIELSIIARGKSQTRQEDTSIPVLWSGRRTMSFLPLFARSSPAGHAPAGSSESLDDCNFCQKGRRSVSHGYLSRRSEPTCSSLSRGRFCLDLWLPCSLAHSLTPHKPTHSSC